MAFIAKTITATFKSAIQPAPLLATTPPRKKETASEVAADYAKRSSMRKARDTAYWEMVFEQQRLLETGESTREGFEKATMEWMRKYPAP